MPHPCPRACGRLATAAVFVSVSVVQFIAGLILLKSKYVYLLSGPDFWTAASNLSVGVVLGVSASVWKDVRKTSFKHIVRRKLLASLVASAIIINSTTAIILILGEGNALLSIQFENDGKSSSTSEILAYSYATSVCSPIVSVVVAVVFLSGMWFRVSDKGMKTPEIKSILKDNINDYNWVFRGRQSPPKQNSKIIRKELSFKSLSSSSDDESFSLTDAKLWSNSVHSIEYLNTSLKKGSNRIGTIRHSKVQQESARECGEHIKNTPGKIPHETSRVSFANDRKSKKIIKFSPYAAQRHLETDSPPHPGQIGAGGKNINSPSYAEFQKKHQHFENSKQRQRKKRMLLMEHPAFQQSKYLEVDLNKQSLHQLASPEIHIPRAHTRVVSKSKFSTTSETEAEVHVNPESQDYIVAENSLESSVVQYEGDVSSCDALTGIIHHKNTTFQRESILKHLNSSCVSRSEDDFAESSVESPIVQYGGDASSCDALPGIMRHKNTKFQRESILKHLNSSGVSRSEDDFANNSLESPIVQCEGDASSCDALPGIMSHKNTKFQRESTLKHLNSSGVSRSEDEDFAARKVCRTSTAAGPSSSKISLLDISDIQTDSVIDQNEPYESEEEKDTLAIASPQPATSQMDSSIEADDFFIDEPQPNMLAGKIVKVQVNSLPRTPFLSKLIPVSIPIVSSVKENPLRRKQKDAVTKTMDKFSRRNERIFSSFHDLHMKAGEANFMNQHCESVNDATVCEISPDENTPPSPAQTSGYDSTIFENAHLSDSESFKLNPSSSVANSPYYTPKKKIQNFPSPRNLDNVHLVTSE